MKSMYYGLVLALVVFLNSITQADDHYKTKLTQNIQALFRENQVTTVEEAFEVIRSEEAKAYLEPQEVGQAILSLSRLSYPSLAFLLDQFDVFDEIFIREFQLNPEWRRGKFLESSENREPVKKQILVPAQECFPIERLSVELQSKAISILDRLFAEESLYTALGGLKPLSFLSFSLSEYPLSELTQIVSVLHCGNLNVTLKSGKNGAVLWIFRSDRVEEIRRQYSTWWSDAGLPLSGDILTVLNPEEEAVRVSPKWVDLEPEVLVSQILLDLVFKEDTKWGEELLQRNRNLISKFVPNLPKNIRIKNIMRQKDFFSGIFRSFDEFLLELLKNDLEFKAIFLKKVNPLLQKKSLEVSQHAPVEELIGKIQRFNQLVQEENKKRHQKNLEISQLPLLDALRLDLKSTQEQMRTASEKIPELAGEIDLEAALLLVDCYNQQCQEKNKRVQTYFDKITGVLLGYPQYAVEYFLSNPIGRRNFLDFPTLRGRNNFTYVIPSEHLPNEEDDKIARGAYRIFSYFIKKKFSSPNSNQIQFYRSFYQIDSDRYAAEAFDHLR